MRHNIAITGATGFVGQNLIPYLKNEGNEVKIIDRNEISAISENIFSGCNAVVHLAGKAHDLKKTANPEAYYEVNFELTKKLYDAFLKSAAKKFIFISSVKAAADSTEEILEEDVIPNPQTHYGKSKLLAEQYIQSQQLPLGKSYYILRPCMIHGPGNKGNLNLLYQFVKRNIPYPLAAFNNQRSFLSIENLCFVINQLIKLEVVSGLYHVSDDQSLSTNSVIQILAKAVDKKPMLWLLPKTMIQVLAKIGDFVKLPLNTERLTKLTENYVVSNHKIKENLAMELPISAEEGLLLTAKSFR